MTPYVQYEYLNVSATADNAPLLLDCYENFGWTQDERHFSPDTGRTVTLHLKRDRKIINRMELTRLQRNFEGCLQEIKLLERSRKQLASIWAAVLAIIGTAFMAGAVFAVTNDPPLYPLMVLLAVPGFAGWVLPYFIYHRLFARQHRKVQPLIDAKYQEIDQLCEKGHALL